MLNFWVWETTHILKSFQKLQAPKRKKAGADVSTPPPAQSVILELGLLLAYFAGPKFSSTNSSNAVNAFLTSVSTMKKLWIVSFKGVVTIGGKS